MALLLIVLRNYLLHVLRNEMLRREPTSQCFLGPGSLFLSAPLILQLCILLRESGMQRGGGKPPLLWSVLTPDQSLQLFSEASIATPSSWRWSCFHRPCRGQREEHRPGLIDAKAHVLSAPSHSPGDLVSQVSLFLTPTPVWR